MPLWGLKFYVDHDGWDGYVPARRRCRPFQMSIISQKSSLCSGRDFILDFCLCGSLGGIFQVPDSCHQIRGSTTTWKLYLISRSTQQEGCPSCTPWPCSWSQYAMLWSCLWTLNAKWAACLWGQTLAMGDLIWSFFTFWWSPFSFCCLCQCERRSKIRR